MLSFVLLNADRGHFRTGRMHLFGGDEVPIDAQCSIRDGLISWERSDSDSAGLVLQVDLTALAAWAGVEAERGEEYAVEPLGTLVLQTCLLPNRASPYLLTLELARRRIMMFLTKLEEWSLFELPATDPVIERFEVARRLFTAALVAQRSSGALSEQAERLAARALVLAIDAGERLAHEAARRELPDRISGATYASAIEHYERLQQEPVPPAAPILLPGTNGVVLQARPMVGCTISPGVFSEALGRVVEAACDFVCVPLRWKDMEPEEGSYAFAGTDRWIEWAVRTAKIPVVAGPIIDFRPACVPDWLYIWENDYETLRELVAEHVKQVVTRYRRTVRRWTVASGLHVNRNFPLGFEQMMDLTRICVGLVRKLHPQSSVVLELTEPWGSYYATNRQSLPPQLYAEMVLQAGIPIDAFGLRVQMGSAGSGQGTRDMMAFSSLLDRYAALEKPIILTGLGAPSAPPPAAELSTLDGDTVDIEPEDVGNPGGCWHRPWSEEVQTDWLGEAMAIALAKPFIHSICWQELYDTATPAEMPSGGVITQAGAAKSSVIRLAEIRRALREGRSPLATPPVSSPATAP